jgi:hypothetical protein
MQHNSHEEDSGIGCSDAECEIDHQNASSVGESSRAGAEGQYGGYGDVIAPRGGGSGTGNMSIQSMLSPSPPAGM